MQQQGILLEILTIKQITETFSNRFFILKISDGKYDQEIQFELTGSNVDIIDEYGEGEEIMVTFNLRGRSYQKLMAEKCWFNSLQAWKIERM